MTAWQLTTIATLFALFDISETYNDDAISLSTLTINRV